MGQKDMDDASGSSSTRTPRDGLGVERVFLRTPRSDFDPRAFSPAEIAARYLIHGSTEHPPPACDASGALDLSRTLVVLPGSRARRLFLRALAEAAGERALVPPVTTTPGFIEEYLFEPNKLESGMSLAGAEVERLAWAHALSNSPARALTDGAHDTSLIERFEAAPVVSRALRELESALKTTQDVIDAARELGERELESRWQAVRSLEIIVAAWLAGRKLVSSLTARTARVSCKPSCQFERVMLLGIAEAHPRFRAALKACGTNVVACVFASERDAHRFDAIGIPDASFAAPLDFEKQALVPCADAEDMALHVLSWLTDAAGDEQGVMVEDITVGIVDPAFAEPVARVAASHGIALHLPEGKRLSQTIVGQVFLRLERALRDDDSRAGTALCAVLGGPAFGGVFGDCESGSPTDPAKWKGQSARALLEYLRDECCERGTATWPRRLVDALLALQNSGSSAETGAERAFESLTRIAWAADTAQHPSKGPFDSERAAIGLLLREFQRLSLQFSSKSTECVSTVALALVKEFILNHALPMDGDEHAIETVGWLELPFDPATRVALLGVHAAALPGTTAETGLLPSALRTKLGLPTAHQRRMRDGFLLSQLQDRLCADELEGSARRLLVLCPRLDIAGNSLLPSPMLFGGTREAVADRAVRFFDEDARKHETSLVCASTATAPSVSPFDALPKLHPYPSDQPLRVTDFKSYLNCPYRWHLCRTEFLEPAREIGAEISVADFGDVIHKCVERVFAAPASATRDAVGVAFEEQRGGSVDQTRRSLHAALMSEFERLGLDAMSTEMLFQGAELRRRLDAFAVWQRQAFAEGWKIIAVEAKFQEPIELADGSTVDLRGRIDRIEYNEAKRIVRLLDFKSFDDVKKTADKDHAKFVKGTRVVEAWSNLQLPLYRLLGRKTWAWVLAPDEAVEVQVGYIILPAGGSTETSLATWDLADDEHALELAKKLALSMRTLVPEPKPLSVMEDFDDFRTVCRATIVRAEDLQEDALEAAGAEQSAASHGEEQS